MHRFQQAEAEHAQQPLEDRESLLQLAICTVKQRPAAMAMDEHFKTATELMAEGEFPSWVDDCAPLLSRAHNLICATV